ncbi:MAG TPA: glycosyltransferase 87 family protein [Streptosporangiaceae bacterium]|nr:glycosyltransferase 87 family protein [Streptosporangiaceae bacterium]
MTQVSTPPAGPAQPAGRPPAPGPGLVTPTGPIERLMSTLIRKLAWSRLSDPKVAVAVSASGLLLGMLLGATAPNAETLPIRLPLSYLLPSLSHQHVIASLILYASDILACLGLAGMLWAHSQGWRPNPRHLLLISSAIVAVMVSLTPVGSSDTASYAAYGRIAAQGGNPYTTNPLAWLGPHSAYTHAVGTMWKAQSSVYGPFATVIQSFAASIGGPHVATTVWVLMILNGAVFIGVGYLLLKTSDDPVRATLFWTANPVLIQQLVSGGHLDTFVAAAAICAIQVARRVPDVLGDVVVGVLIGLACGIKIYAVLIGLGLALPLLWRHEWMRTARIVAVSLVTLAIGYSAYGLDALKPLFGGLQLVTLPSPWRVFQLTGQALGVGGSTMATVISFLWPIALVVVAWLIYQRISSDQPREVVAPFALAFAWILVAPWVFAWYTAVAWAALTQVPRNRMTRWLAIVTVLLALCLSSGGRANL